MGNGFWMNNSDILSFIIYFSIFEFLVFLGLLNALRYRKYGKLIRIDANIPKEIFTSDSTIAYGIFIFILFNVLSILIIRLWGLIFSISWIVFISCFFYWFWHTKEDPFRRFHHEQKVWDDPRDKKEKQSPRK